MGIFADNRGNSGQVVQGDANKLGNWIIKRFELLLHDRLNWDDYWDDLSFYLVPKKNNVYGERISGDRRSEDILFDNTSVHSNELLASALHSMLTSPTSVWFGLTTGNEIIDRKDTVRKWIDDTVRRMILVFNNSNFQTEVHEHYIDLGSFGTGVLLLEEDDDTVVRFKASPIYEHYIQENNKGLVDTVYRRYKWTARQIIQEFGHEKVPGDIKEKSNRGDPELIEIVHGVGPRKDRNISRKDPSNKPFFSTHVLRDTRVVLKDSGFDENPYIVARWSKASGEIYGRSPGMKALADIKMLNTIMKVSIQAGQLSIAPPLQVPDDGILLPIKTHPHAVNIYRAGSKDRIEPLNTGVDPNLGEEMAQAARERIRAAFFINQLQLSENNPQMTATEVVQRTEEKLRLLGPVLGRQHFEFLQPLVERVFAIMLRKGKILPPPDDVQKLNIEYTSQLVRAQKAQEADNFARAQQIIGPIAQVDPTIMDMLDNDEIVKWAAKIHGLPTQLIRDDDEVAQIRADRAQAQQAQAQAEQQKLQAEALDKGAQGAAKLAEAGGIGG